MPAPGWKELRQSAEEIGLQGADRVEAEVMMGAGELEVKGGADQLLEAVFRYSADDLVPDVVYRVGENSVGSLRVGQDERPANNFNGSYYNKWELRFNSEVPLTLILALGAGDCSLDLEDINLRTLALTMGAGEANLDLGAPSEQDLDVEIQGGVGQLTVNLPPDARIEAEVSGGLGEINLSGLQGTNGFYVSEYQGAGPVIRIKIQAGIGELNLLVR
ncbi:MAG: toast rack family protein, partial [Anaerolineales bacterium]